MKSCPPFAWTASTSSRNWSSGVVQRSNSARDGSTEGRIHRTEIRRRERATVLSHHGVGRRHRERRKRLDDAEAHHIHDVTKLTANGAEGTELAREHGVDGVGAARGGGRDLDAEIAALRPFRHGGAVREKAALPVEHANLLQRDRHGKRTRGRLGHRKIRPFAAHIRPEHGACVNETARVSPFHLSSYSPQPGICFILLSTFLMVLKISAHSTKSHLPRQEFTLSTLTPILSGQACLIG